MGSKQEAVRRQAGGVIPALQLVATMRRYLIFRS